MRHWLLLWVGEERRLEIIAVIQVGDEGRGAGGAVERGGVAGFEIHIDGGADRFTGRLDGGWERKVESGMTSWPKRLRHQETLRKSSLRGNEEVIFLQCNRLNICVPSKFVC